MATSPKKRKILSLGKKRTPLTIASEIVPSCFDDPTVKNASSCCEEQNKRTKVADDGCARKLDEIIEIKEDTLEDLQNERTALLMQLELLQKRLHHVDNEISEIILEEASNISHDLTKSPTCRSRPLLTSPSPLKSDVQIHTSGRLWNAGTSGFDLVNGDDAVYEPYRELSPNRYLSMPMPTYSQTDNLIIHACSDSGVLTQFIRTLGESSDYH
jgi:hypothetical protein